MSLNKLAVGAIAAATLASPMLATSASADLFIPSMVYRTGPYAPNGVPFANGYKDYWMYLNAKDGGIGGAKIVVEECETGYNTKVGVECYEKLKGKGALAFSPLSTGITYQLIPKASVDKIPVLSMGYGRTSAADGRVFEWIFNFPTTYWSQASAVIKYIGGQVGGMDKLKGKKIVHIYHNSAYGKEANPTLEALQKKFGYELTLLAVDHPGQEQAATWLQIRRLKPDFIFMSGWGVMNQVAIKEASAIGFPMDKFIGNWWSGTETDVIPAGKGSNGYKSTTFHSPGAGFPLHKDILAKLHAKGKGSGPKDGVGEVLYNRGMLNAIFIAEAIRAAQKKTGKKDVTASDVRWGLENIDINQARWTELGLPGFVKDIKVTCKDHEGNHPVTVQQWDAGAKKWKIVSDWIVPMNDVVRPMIEKDAAAFAKENNITPRACN